MTAYTTRRLVEKEPLRAFLNRDRVRTAYAIGDLDEAFWPQSTFYGAERGGQLEAVVLVYGGLEPAVLTAFGEADGVAAIFATQPLPDEVYYLFLPEMGPILSAAYDTSYQQREWRMVLDAAAFAAPSLDGLARLESEHAGALADLYRHIAGPGEEVVAFSPWQIAHGMFFGVWAGETLVATAGTHVWSPAEGVAAIGNVFTHPDHRRRGYATRCTAAVTGAALAAGIDTVILNVRCDNAPAIHVYEKLGFRLHGTFLDGPGFRRD